uniref:Thymidylate kinase n=1 Tax=Loofah witches'-broom phytoplasma TaxID=35773 RepID=Q93UI7_LOWBP|nr:TMP kinase [Candidatus Phytoplasma luffae]
MKLIVFEGLDGSGKTTLIQELQQKLKKQKINNKIYQGLGSSSIGTEIRNLFLNYNQVDYITRFYLSITNMAQIQKELIYPHLKQNQLIILDRWLPSTYAYQLFPYLKQTKSCFDLKELFDITHKKLFIQPHLLIYLDINPLIGKERKQTQKNHQLDIIEQKSLTYHQTVHKGYYHYLTHYQNNKQLILNGIDSLQSNVTKIMKLIRDIK